MTQRILVRATQRIMLLFIRKRVRGGEAGLEGECEPRLELIASNRQQ